MSTRRSIWRPGQPGDGVCRLLFVGTDWGRKGGAIALQVLRRLQGLGVQARMTLVGAAPPEPVDLPGVEFVGQPHKNLPEHRNRLNSALSGSELLRAAHPQ